MARCRVIGHNKTRFDKEIAAKQKAGETIHVQEVKDPVEESRYVLERIQEYQSQGIPYSQMAVLYRTSLDARMLSETLMEYQVPFTMKERLNNIYEHFIGTDISSYFHLAKGEPGTQIFPSDCQPS